MRYIALTGEEAFRLEDGSEVTGGPNELLAEDGLLIDLLGGEIRERGRVAHDDLELFDFDQFGVEGHIEWNGFRHELVVDEPAPES